MKSAVDKILETENSAGRDVAAANEKAVQIQKEYALKTADKCREIADNAKAESAKIINDAKNNADDILKKAEEQAAELSKIHKKEVLTQLENCKDVINEIVFN